MCRLLIHFVAVIGVACGSTAAFAGEPLRVAAFQADATPPIGSPVAYAPTRSIEDPLSARGIVLLGAGKPIVLCAVDWIGIGNGGQDTWKEKLAAAAGTTANRVAVHTLHQHDGPRCDFTAAALLEKEGLAARHFDTAFARTVIERTAKAIRTAVAKQARPVTHIGVGVAKVEKVASNRRILGPDGKVKIIRWSKSTNPAAIAAPEGVIDPILRLISFWNADTPLVSLTYYATHPQSYYGKGDVTSEFVGIARAMREKALPGIAHIHFNGASGNVAAGKYNDGSKRLRPILAGRMAKGMAEAWKATEKQPIAAADVEWRTTPVKLPAAKHLEGDKLRAILGNKKADARSRLGAASHLAWLERNRAGGTIDVTCLKLGSVHILHLPGELFIEYQLAAQKLKPKATVCMAAYGDYGPGYIGTEIAYSQGGYETSPRASRVAPAVEKVLMQAIRKVLQTGDASE